MAELIDTRHMGNDRVIGAWETDGLIVDPGPASTVEALLEGLGEVEPRALLLTHIHLDHAAASGTLCRRFPDLRVYVHERGAPHMVDPTRLWESASRLYGAENMVELWGEVIPVGSERITTVTGGDRVEGMRVIDAPGHASHHVVYFDPDAEAAYCGDVAGVRIPGGELTIMPTPPPEIDLEAWHRSVDAVDGLGASSLHLTHFGEVTEVGSHLENAREMLRKQGEASRDLDRDAFMQRLGRWIDDQDEAAAESMRAAMPPDQVWLGLERYWRKRSEGAATSA